MAKAEQYLQDARTIFAVAKGRDDLRGKVFDYTEAIACARLAIVNAPYADGAKVRSDAGKIEYDAREALCSLLSAA